MKSEIYSENSTFKGLVSDWEELLGESTSPDIFLTWQWQSSWWRHFGKDKELRLLAVREEAGGLLGLASFSIESCSKGKRVMRFLGGTDVTDYLDVVSRSGYEEELCKKTLEFWESVEGEWDSIDLRCLKESSITLKVLKQLVVERGYSVEVSQEDVCPRLYLPRSWEEYLESLNKKDRHELRRKVRRIQRVSKSFDDYTIKDPESLAEGMQRFISLHRKSDAHKEGFMDKHMEGFFQTVARVLFPENWLRLSFLQIDGSHVAASLCFDYKNKIYLYNSGYDPDYSFLSPGIVLAAYLIREAIALKRTEFDFLRGREPYKYRLGAQNSSIYRMTIEKKGSA